jgi:hypothetical protein
LRIVEITTFGEVAELTPEQEAEAIRDLGGNAQHYHCMNMSASPDDGPGLNERRLFFRTKVATKRNPDRLKAYLPVAHERGVRVIVYFNVHWYSAGFAEAHPDFMQRRYDRSLLDNLYNNGCTPCINSPYREWVFQVLRDLCKYDIDGIFYDGPVFFPETCYCETCRRLFKERTGKQPPRKADHRHPLWREFIEFQGDSMARFLEDSLRVVREAKPEVLLYINGNANWPWWPSGLDNERDIRHADLLGAEGGFIAGDLNQTPLYKPGVTAKLLDSQAQGKPTVVFDCAGHKSWSWYLLPEPEISQLMAQTVANGANCWVAVFPDDLAQPEMQVIRDYNRLIKRHPQAFCGTRSLATAALLWLSQGSNVYEGSSVPFVDRSTQDLQAQGVGDLTAEFNGFYEALARAQIPCDVLGEAALEDLARYELLVLPNAAALSEAAVASLAQFVRRGGNLVADFETSLYDETGARRPDLGLAEVLGVQWEGEIFGPMDWDYVAPVPGLRSRALQGITKLVVPAPPHGIAVRPTTGRVLAYYAERLKGRYDHAPIVSPQPFLTENRYGRGRSYFVAGTLGASLSSFRFPDHLRLVRNLARSLSTPPVEITGAPWVELSLRGRPGKTYLHLLNQTGGPKRPTTWVQSLHDLPVALRQPATRARALRAGQTLPLERTKTGVNFRLPELRDYEVIEFKVE